jgi:hypothetical protein
MCSVAQRKAAGVFFSNRFQVWCEGLIAKCLDLKWMHQIVRKQESRKLAEPGVMLDPCVPAIGCALRALCRS